jgi:flagellar biosynthesis protein FlhB
MSEERDDKTEDATDKRLSDARAEGNVPVSRELPVAFALIGMTFAIAFTAEPAVQFSSNTLTRLLDHAGDIRLVRGADALALLWALLLNLAAALAPSLVALMLCGLTGGVLQRPIALTPARLVPDASRVSISAGFKRLFGTGGLIDFAKSFAKLLIISTVATVVVRRQLTNALDPMATEPSQMLWSLRSLVIPLLTAIAASVALMAGLDVLWTRRQWLESLRMSRQEIKDESRESQGDPLVKGRMRAMARQRARSRMMAAVPRASFIVANPTHYAVALRYVLGEGEAPKVLAKGKDLAALRIREIAEAHSIPVVENKPLARALHDVARVDAVIPQDFYRPVAEIVNFLNRKGRVSTPAPLPNHSLRKRL